MVKEKEAMIFREKKRDTWGEVGRKKGKSPDFFFLKYSFFGTQSSSPKAF